jgi:hypothetical protein
MQSTPYWKNLRFKNSKQNIVIKLNFKLKIINVIDIIIIIFNTLEELSSIFKKVIIMNLQFNFENKNQV